MKIIPLTGAGGWDAPGNHDSRRQPRDLAELIRQVATLPGIAQRNFTGVPGMIKLFAEKCLFGEREIYVVKGILQRWGNNADPHIRVRFQYTVGPEGKRGEEDQVKSIKRGAVAPALFAIPAGYTKK